jgi:hypothetical protein
MLQNLLSFQFFISYIKNPTKKKGNIKNVFLQQRIKKKFLKVLKCFTSKLTIIFLKNSSGKGKEMGKEKRKRVGRKKGKRKNYRQEKWNTIVDTHYLNYY